jgi:hypothetical protein
MKIPSLKVSFLIPLLLLIACSIPKKKEVSIDTKFTVIQVCSEYLAAVIRGDEGRIGNYASWKDLLSSENGSISMEEFRKELAVFQQSYSAKDHPLLGLEIKKLEIEEDDAFVVFKKFGAKDSPEITITLQWVSSAWMVIEDSIFGKGEYAEYLLKQKP